MVVILNCCDEYGNCTQGRDCPIRKTRALDRNLFWDVMEGLVTLGVVIGIITSMCFMFGYIWYRVTP
jgi:hypothetical protein